MIENNIIDLSQSSTVRMDARNTIKYTLLLDYSAPLFKDDISLIYDILEKCQSCCSELFVDFSAHKVTDARLKLFGNASKTIYGKEYDKHSIDTSKIFSLDSPMKRAGSFADSFKTPHIDYMILQHCIVSCYHAILTDLKRGQAKTLYNTLFAPHLSYPYNKNNYDLTNAQKSSKSSDFKRTTKSHIQYLPQLSGICISPTEIDEGYRIMEPFAELWYDICGVQASKFKNLYFMKEYTGSNSYTSARTTTLLNNVIEINRALTPKYNNDRFFTDSVDSLYQCYLNERIFNLRLFYTLYKVIDYVNMESPYRLDQGIYYSTFTMLKKLPNVFSRQAMLIAAISHINENVHTERDFWREHDIKNQDSVMSSAHKVKKEFNMHIWNNQLNLFVNYLSEFIIPVYEWCFLNMLLESIEEKHPEKDYQSHLEIACSLLRSFIKDNYKTILNPLDLEPDHSLGTIADIITPIEDTFVASTNISNDFIDKLYRVFFNTEDIININLSQNLTPAYFRFNRRNSPNQPMNQIRNNYIDLLRYQYWEEDMPIFEKN